MSSYASALGACKKCGRDKIQVEESIKCIFCDYDFNEPKGPVVNIEDPGETEINRVLAASGVKIDYAKNAQKTETPKAGMVPTAVVKAAVTPQFSFEQGIGLAIDTLRALPMPKDLKQFKVVAKTIKSLESLLGEDHGK